MVLDEGDGGLRGLDGRGLLYDGDVVLRAGRDLLVHGSYGTVAEGESYDKSKDNLSEDESERHLSCYLDPSVEPVFVAAEGFDVVVGKAQCPKDEGGDEHEQEVDVAQVADEYDGQ